MRSVDWYFDFISPYSYLCLQRMPRGVDVRMRPVLFAGLLNHFGQKGPAEIPAKRRWTYRWCVWWAKELGIPFRFPAEHPFNPLPHLRLALACGNERDAVKRIFDWIWMTGENASDPARFDLLCRNLGTDPARLADPSVKDQLRKNSEEAVGAGVFGVPSFVADGEVFWGADAIDFLKAYLRDPAVLGNAEMRRVDALPVGAARKA